MSRVLAYFQKGIKPMTLTIAGWIIGPLITLVLGWIVSNLQKNNRETGALKNGMQALLRDRLLQSYRYFHNKGYVEFDDRENFENMYQNYHALGANGVMDDVHKKFLELPIERSQDHE